MKRTLCRLTILFGATLLACWLGSLFRAAAYGPTLRVLLGYGLFGIPLAVLAGLLGGLLRDRRVICSACLKLAALVLGMSILLPESWFGFEDLAFRREVRVHATPDHYSRARWQPFESYYLMFEDGVFSAGD